MSKKWNLRCVCCGEVRLVVAARQPRLDCGNCLLEHIVILPMLAVEAAADEAEQTKSE